MFPFTFIGKVADPPPPSLGTPTATLVTHGAACTGVNCQTKSGSNDTISVSWTISGANDEFFQAKIYRNGTLQTTQNSTNNSYVDTAPGATGWAGGPVSVDYVYRVDIVSINEGNVVASASSAHFVQTFFTTCPGPC